MANSFQLIAWAIHNSLHSHQTHSKYVCKRTHHIIRHTHTQKHKHSHTHEHSETHTLTLTNTCIEHIKQLITTNLWWQAWVFLLKENWIIIRRCVFVSVTSVRHSDYYKHCGGGPRIRWMNRNHFSVTEWMEAQPEADKVEGVWRGDGDMMRIVSICRPRIILCECGVFRTENIKTILHLLESLSRQHARESPSCVQYRGREVVGFQNQPIFEDLFIQCVRFYACKWRLLIQCLHFMGP